MSPTKEQIEQVQDTLGKLSEEFDEISDRHVEELSPIKKRHLEELKPVRQRYDEFIKNSCGGTIHYGRKVKLVQNSSMGGSPTKPAGSIATIIGYRKSNDWPYYILWFDDDELNHLKGGYWAPLEICKFIYEED